MLIIVCELPHKAVHSTQKDRLYLFMPIHNKYKFMNSSWAIANCSQTFVNLVETSFAKYHTCIPIENLPQLIGLLCLTDHLQNHDKRWSSAKAVILISLTNMFNISANGRHIILPSQDLVMSNQWKCNLIIKHTKALCVTAFAKRVLIHNSFSNVTWSTGICTQLWNFEERPSYIALMWEQLVQYFLQMKWYASLKL